MEPHGSLPYSQVPATCPYPEPDRSSPCTYILLPGQIHLNTFLPSTPGSPKWSLSLRFSHQNPVYTSPLPRTSYTFRSSHSSRFYHPNIRWGVQIIQLLIMHLPPLPCYLVPPRPKYSPKHPILKLSQPTFLPQCEWPTFTPIEK